MPYSATVPTENVMSHMVARCGLARLGVTRLGFAPTRAADQEVDLDGRYLWLQTDGPKALDPSLTWTTTET